jgi:phosphatidylglycerol:prolipoprotein diacylglycerol transferase
LLAAVFSGILFIRKKNMGLLKTGDVIMAVLPVGQMFGRIGCFLNGCCFGTPCTLPFRVIYPMNSHAFQHYQEFQPVHPVQLYESLGTGLLFLALISIIERKRFHGQIVALYGMLYPALRFVMEFMRGDTTRHAADLTFAQYLSIPIFLISFVLYRVWSRKADRFAASSP